MRVGDEQIAVAIEIQSRRAAVIVSRRLPLVEIIAVGVEHLNAGRHIDDVKAVARIDGDRPRLAEAAFRDSGASPDFFQFAGRAGIADAAGRDDQRSEKQAQSR